MRSIGRRAAIAALGLLFTVLAPSASADPPTRVLRLSFVNGAVSFSAAGTDDWVLAPLNRPVVYGDQLWADQDGQSELSLGNATLWMGPRTSVRVLNLDDRVAQFEVAQGSVALRVRRLGPNDTLEIDTPNLAFVVTRPGRYRVNVDEQGDATLVAVRDGAAEVYGGSSSYAVARGQTYRFYGTDLSDSEILPAPAQDPFERFTLDRDRRFDRAPSTRFVSADVIGYEDLDRYGAWSTAPEYGNVWYPRGVASDWAPYRDGHWSWIDPWGWTWVDDAPWGFAPFHYGRWIYATNRWGWVPGPANVRPVYGPAFVAFVDAGNVRVSVSGGGGPAIGWFPLGPREVYRPSYAASAQYIRQVNVSNTVINNVTVINNAISNRAPPQINTYVNLRAPNGVTAVPPAAMAQGQTVTRIATVIPGNAVQAAAIQPYARVAPAPQAIAPGRPAQAKPPAQTQTRPVVARNAPPPPPQSVSQRLPELQRNPGKPVDVRAAAPAAVNAAPPSSAPGAPAQPGGARPAPAGGAPGAAPPANVRVVSSPKPASTAAPPAKAPDAARAGGPRAPQAPQPVTAQPPAGQPPGAQPPGAQPPGAQPPRGETRAPTAAPPAPAPVPQGPAGRPAAAPPAPPPVPQGQAGPNGRERVEPPRPPQPTEQGVTTPPPPPAPTAPAPREQRQAPVPAPVPQPPRPAPERQAPPAAAPAPPPAQAPAADRSRVLPPNAPQNEVRPGQPTERPAGPRGPQPTERVASPPPPPQSAPQAPPRAPEAAPAARAPERAPPPAPQAQPPRPPEARPAAPPPPPAQAPRPPDVRPASPPPPPARERAAPQPDKDKEKDKDKDKDKKDNK